jgi:hypothetical protein
MNIFILQLAASLLWLAVIAGAYQRIIDVPKWFANPPSSFEVIRQQSRKIALFTVPLLLLLTAAFAWALFLNSSVPRVRNYILASIVCFMTGKALSAAYFVKEIVAFSKTPVTAPKTPALVIRVKFWQRWTFLRDVLQVFAALLITLARASATA